MTTRLVQISKVFCNDHPDTILVKCIVSALKCLGGPLAKEEVKELLKNPFYFIRYEAVKAMIVLGDKVDIPELSLIAIQDKYEAIRKCASYAIKVIKMKNGL